jgi:hypothetical protein
MLEMSALGGIPSTPMAKSKARTPTSTATMSTVHRQAQSSSPSSARAWQFSLLPLPAKIFDSLVFAYGDHQLRHHGYLGGPGAEVVITKRLPRRSARAVLDASAVLRVVLGE